MSAFGKAAFEGSSSEGDMQNAKCPSMAPLATWLHVYSFSPVCRPTTNKCPKYSRHSVRDLVQTASSVELKRALTPRLLMTSTKIKSILTFFVYQLWEQILLCLAFRSAVLIMSFTATKFTMYPFIENLQKYFLGSSETIIHVSCRVCEAGTVRERWRHLWLEILKCPWTLGWLSSWSQSTLLKMVLNFTNAHKALIIRKKIPWVYGWNSVVMKLWDWTETLLH